MEIDREASYIAFEENRFYCKMVKPRYINTSYVIISGRLEIEV